MMELFHAGLDLHLSPLHGHVLFGWVFKDSKNNVSKMGCFLDSMILKSAIRRIKIQVNI